MTRGECHNVSCGYCTTNVLKRRHILCSDSSAKFVSRCPIESQSLPADCSPQWRTGTLHGLSAGRKQQLSPVRQCSASSGRHLCPRTSLRVCMEEPILFSLIAMFFLVDSDDLHDVEDSFIELC